MKVSAGSLAILVFSWVCFAETGQLPRTAPVYAPSGVVNSANSQAGPVAPNTIVTLYGSGLAYVTKAMKGEDVKNGVLPISLPGAGVKVLVNHVAANLYFVSPKQVNFLIPSSAIPGPADVQLGVDGVFGAPVKIQLTAAAPAIFQSDPEFVIATFGDGTVITRESPAKPGDVIVLYATGLGVTRPRASAGQIATAAAPLDRLKEFRVQIGEASLASTSVLYAGLTPGFGGLYQVNLRLPDDLLAENPEIRIGFDGQMSAAGVKLPFKLR